MLPSHTHTHTHTHTYTLTHSLTHSHNCKYFQTTNGSSLAGGAYTGGASAGAGDVEVVLSADPYGPGTGSYAPSRDMHVGSNWEGAALAVLGGAGEGQWRRVVANHNRTWRVDRPLDAALDSTSIVQVVPLRGHVLLLGSSWTTSLTVQLYGICLHAVVAQCDFDTTPLLSWGRSPHFWGYQVNIPLLSDPCYGVVLNCALIDGSD